MMIALLRARNGRLFRRRAASSPKQRFGARRNRVVEFRKKI
jgi:hypothetical protein